MAFSRRFQIVDLFAGCGGISRGFQRTGRFGVDFAVELEPHAAGAFQANIRNCKDKPTPVFVGDIRDLSADSEALSKRLAEAGVAENGTLDVLVGGPPCQGFSRNGVRQYVDPTKRSRFYDDPRNHLYREFLHFVELLQPKVIMIENVREFLNFGGGTFSSDLLEKLDSLGYDADYRKICAADYGVPQMRHRVIFLAARRDIIAQSGKRLLFPTPQYGNAMEGGLQLQPPYFTVHDAIGDLGAPAFSHSASPVKYRSLKKVSSLAKLMQSPEGSVKNHVARKLSPKQVERICAVGTGRMRDIDDELKTEKFYGSAYRRLSWDEPALTITTWVYHVGSGRFAHPSEDRGITMREAARLQSFDDEFVFPPLINPVSRMIGNAVPPLLAQAFAEEIAAFLEAADRRR